MQSSVKRKQAQFELQSNGGARSVLERAVLTPGEAGRPSVEPRAVVVIVPRDAAVVERERVRRAVLVTDVCNATAVLQVSSQDLRVLYHLRV